MIDAAAGSGKLGEPEHADETDRPRTGSATRLLGLSGQVDDPQLRAVLSQQDEAVAAGLG